MKRRAAGTYNHEKAAKLFLFLADAGAKKYYKEYTSGTGFKFDLATRWAVAKSLRDSFEQEAELGNYDKMVFGVSNNPKRKASKAQSNPTGGRRKVTMSLEKFAKYIKAKNDPKLWNDFIRKIKGYQKWTHGSLPKNVTIEVVDKPGMSGLWMTYDAGTVPESAYVMPSGSKRKGAWKHPWDTPPKIKHDPDAGIIMHKISGSSKMTDFYHK
jgi:hypothetical protein